MNELIKKLFEGVEGLSPEFLDRADTLISVAISEEADKRISEQTKAINESFDARLDEAKQEFVTENTFRLDAFLEKTILEWSKENSVQLDALAKVELAEQFLTGFKTLFTEANITIPKGDEKAVLEGLQAKLVAAEGKLEEAEAKLAEQEAILEATKRAEILKELTTGLAETQVERIEAISKDFALTNEEEFRRKVGYVVEAVGGKKDDKKDDKPEDGKEKTEDKPEDEKDKIVETQTKTVVLDPIVEAYFASKKKRA